MLFAVASPLAAAANMVAVPKEEAICRNTDAYCYEWKFAVDPSLRFVATGYEDGGGFYFCRRRPNGDYGLLFAVYPAMLDSKHPGVRFWGYAWDIEDIVLSGGGKAIQFQMAIGGKPEEEGSWIPPMQRSVPYVLFRGSTTQPEMKVKGRLRFTGMSLNGIRRKAMANQSLRSTACGVD
ncbi:hypothetical protein HNQ51_002303 [Inhella inkyongensis]|uniref:Uncharacterized protein n=1 Tax=Inhella inkyongensis TaxID=392593 RepID=A0A840S863_9BURK|nr:hypothetical protein [Inhella inkyongensis]MBB5204984.1 hypothetical protein [Inhella inkyongensis]